VFGFLVVTFVLVVSWGCAKKTVRQGVPFDLDGILTTKVLPKQENWREKGIRLARERNYDEAVEAFKNFVLEDPENYVGFNALAVCYKNMGDHSGAMKNFERALEFAGSPEDRAKVLANIGNLYFSARKYQVALGYYKEAASEFDKNPLYLILVSRTFAALNEPERARKVLTVAEDNLRQLEKYETEEDRGLGYYIMAEVWAALTDEQRVLDYLEKALKANPERSARRILQGINDEKNLLYTLKDDPLLKKRLDRYSAGSGLEGVQDKERSRRTPWDR